MPDVESLLSSTSDHSSPYWQEVQDFSDDPGALGLDASKAIDSLVDMIRRRVGGALSAADGDTEAALASLRNIYREIKTQQISLTAEAVSRSRSAP